MNHRDWRQVASRIVDAINNGTLKPGDVVTQQHLSDQKIVPKETADEALEWLEKANVLLWFPELGCIVHPNVAIPIAPPQETSLAGARARKDDPSPPPR